MDLKHEKRNDSKFYLALYLLFLSLYFGRFNIYIGFSIKPFMIITSLIILLFFNKMRFDKLFIFEFMMLSFIVFHSMTAFNFQYPESSIRFIILYLIIFIFYFSARGLLINTNIKTVEVIISKTGFIGIVFSIIYYLMGIYASGMNYRGNNISYYGMLIDRSIPRFTGATADDPNIYVFYITLYFCYTLINLNSKKNKLGCFLSAITIVLTFSRGAYVSIAIALIILLIVSNNNKMKLRVILTGFITTIILYVAGDKFSTNPIKYIMQRFSAVSQDGGSGRITIWLNAINTFKENPVFGIGINSTIEYSLAHYSRGNYVHNSLLEVLGETGVLGFMLYMFFWISIFYYSIKLISINKKTTFLLIAFVAMFIQMNFLSTLYSEIFYFAILLLYRYSREYLVNTRVS